jgi:tRNA G37 N-methylase Trm5
LKDNLVKRWILQFRLWWHRDILEAVADIRSEQCRFDQAHKESLDQLWANLAQWWQKEYVNVKPPSEWPTVGDVGIAKCPECAAAYEIRKLVPQHANHATLVCNCGQHMDVYRDSFYGWLKPRVEYRKKSYL